MYDENRYTYTILIHKDPTSGEWGARNISLPMGEGGGSLAKIFEEYRLRQIKQYGIQVLILLQHEKAATFFDILKSFHLSDTHQSMKTDSKTLK